jgi:hypothetical protein
MAKVTLSTIKAFIRKNRPNLLISNLSEFDSMVDGVSPTENKAFRPAEQPEEGRNFDNCLGVRGAWFVFGSWDYFTEFERNGVKGFHVYNCCGSFDIGVRS